MPYPGFNFVFLSVFKHVLLFIHGIVLSETISLAKATLSFHTTGNHCGINSRMPFLLQELETGRSSCNFSRYETILINYYSCSVVSDVSETMKG